MNSKIDFKKMMSQEPEFDKYVRQVLIDVMLADPNMQSMLETIFAFYQSGSTSSQTSEILKSLVRGQR